MALNRALLSHVTLDPARDCSEPQLQDSEGYAKQRLSVTELEENRAPCEVALS